MKRLFTATATAVGGRNGHSEASDGTVSVDLSVPKAMGGPGKPGTTTPEHLFATGYSACFGSAIDYVAKLQKKAVERIEVTGDVTIGTRDDGGFGLEVELRIKLSGVSAADARAIVEKAHTICPYSNAIRGNVPVTLTVVE
ncbi:MAG: organic hydroperoxide resistance protein [Phycisphaerales bacterium]|nr:organic hydroperoxide resistance protein [Phycisphaerales bacterium]